MPAPTTEPKPAPPKTRKPRAPSEYIIQQNQAKPSDGDNIWVEITIDEPINIGGIDDTASAIAYLKSKNMEGQFRILAVKKVLTLKAETVTKMRVG